MPLFDPMTMIPKKTFFYILLFMLLAISTTALAELGMRIYHYSHKRLRYIYLPDYYLGHTLAPNNDLTWWGDDNHPEFRTHQRTNSLGFLGQEVPARKPDGTYRIVVMGDSFTEGFQVQADENYCRLLEQKLNQDTHDGQKIEIINAGVRGYSPIRYYLLYKQRIAPLDPDLIIVQLFANDVYEDNFYKAKSILDPAGLPQKINVYFSDPKPQTFLGPGSIILKAHHWLIDHSRLYEYIVVQAAKKGKRSPVNTRMESLPQFAESNIFFIIQNSKPEDISGDPDFFIKSWKTTRDYLTALKNEASQNGTHLLMFYIPMEAQLKRDRYGDNATAYFSSQASLRINKLLEGFSEENHIPYLDLTPAFQAHAQEELYFNWDGHLTPEGHQIVADALSSFIESKFSFKN